LQILKAFFLVGRGEWRPLLWSAAYFFLLLCGYFILRPAREAMGIARGFEALPWLMTGTLLAMLVASPAFAALVSRLPRRRFIPLTYRFFASNLVVFWVLLWIAPEANRDWLGFAFYIWLSVYNLFAVSIFWAVVSDIFTSEQGKRLFGLIGIGGTCGAICGSLFVTFAAGLGGGVSIAGFEFRLGPEHLILVTILFIEGAVQCVKRLGVSAGMDATGAREPGPGALEGLRLMARSPYLLLISIYMILFTTLSTYLYLEQGRLVGLAAPTRAERTVIFARIDLFANLLTLFVQLFLTGRLVSRLGVAAALGVLPLLSAVGFAWLLTAPSLGVLMVFQVLRRGLHHGISRPAREVLYTVVSPDARYKSKSFIDTFVYRAGDMAGAWTPVLLGKMGIPIAMAGIPIAGAWLASGVVLGRLHRRVELTGWAAAGDTGRPAPGGKNQSAKLKAQTSKDVLL
jgi:ATP:ADP antiporter, AAA family